MRGGPGELISLEQQSRLETRSVKTGLRTVRRMTVISSSRWKPGGLALSPPDDAGKSGENEKSLFNTRRDSLSIEIGGKGAVLLWPAAGYTSVSLLMTRISLRISIQGLDIVGRLICQLIGPWAGHLATH